MIIMLKKAFKEVSKLSEIEQNIVAKMFANSEKMLEEIANEAIIEHEN